MQSYPKRRFVKKNTHVHYYVKVFVLRCYVLCTVPPALCKRSLIYCTAVNYTATRNNRSAHKSPAVGIVDGRCSCDSNISDFNDCCHAMMKRSGRSNMHQCDVWDACITVMSYREAVDRLCWRWNYVLTHALLIGYSYCIAYRRTIDA